MLSVHLDERGERHSRFAVFALDWRGGLGFIQRRIAPSVGRVSREKAAARLSNHAPLYLFHASSHWCLTPPGV